MRVSLEEDRYDRQRLISWWDQDRLSAARVLVIGAGALGNEIIKNLALLGVGQIDIVDLDHIEHSNLARCVLFREQDESKAKAEVAAQAAMRLNPDVRSSGMVADVRRFGIGHLLDYDVTIAGLDNREARAWINQACRKLGRYWVDGAIEGLRGVARVFAPEGPCYECTLGEMDRELMARRRSCSLLTPEEMLGGKTPTTATSASIIGGIETQEAVKLLNGRTDLLALSGRAFMMIGETMDTYFVQYSEDPECLAHDHYETVEARVYDDDTTATSLLGVDAGADVALEFESEIVASLTCPDCDHEDRNPKRLLDISPGGGICPECGAELRVDPRLYLQEDDPIAAIPLWQIGIPDREVVTLRRGAERTHILLKRVYD